MTNPSFLIGTRGSPLALAQAQMVAAALEQRHGWPVGHVQLQIIRTTGDKVQDRALSEVGGKAMWTKELDLVLGSGETQCSVHSMKDVESIRPEGFVLAAMLERAEVCDRLIGAGSLDDLPPGARVGTSSPRRAAQVRRHRPDLVTEVIRGNVETRLSKQQAGDVDATLLAAAGLDRLGRGETGSPIPVDTMLPAPAQGAIGIECRVDDERTRALLAGIDHRPTHQAVLIERAFTRALGGTCHSPVAALAELVDERLRFRVALYSENGQDAIEAERWLDVNDVIGAAALADELLADAPDSIRRLFAAV